MLLRNETLPSEYLSFSLLIDRERNDLACRQRVDGR